MKAVIGNTLIASLKVREKPYEVMDVRLRGFFVRVQPNGSILYYVQLGRHRRLSIGRAGAVGQTIAIPPDIARAKAKELLGEDFRGNDPIAAKQKKKKSHTLRTFVDEVYEPWAKANLRVPDKAINRLNSNFAHLLDKRLHEITPLEIEKWRIDRAKKVKASTINRTLEDLKSSFNRAVTWGIIEKNPIAGVKKTKADPNVIVRFLSHDEERHLRNALLKREETIREERRTANEWRAARGRPLFPSLSNLPFADRLRPMVLTSLNTGIRQGELFGLEWEDVNFALKLLTIHGFKAKSGKTRHIPLNDEAYETLHMWNEISADTKGLVFPSDSGGRLDNVNFSWRRVMKAAGIVKFRWHDMRHSFASHLVMAGVDLNTVRELLGHSDYAMTLRYAHLAPAHTAAAVAKLVRSWDSAG